MKLLALIPARGGSKRLPGKNIRSFGGKPLIVWSIDAARDVPEICDILVSTDDQGIARIASEAGALVPWLRPAEISTDTSTAAQAALHAIEWYERERGPIDGLMLLQPTSPFRSRESVIAGVELFRTHGRRPIVGVSPTQGHPMWCFRIERDTMKPFVEGGGLHIRSQDLPPAYLANGAFYLIAPSDLRSSESFYRDDMVPLVMNEWGSIIDIDTERDWKLAEAAFSAK